MHYGQIFKADIANGPGVRVSVFVSGCRNHCKGCFQPETWDFCYGKMFTKETEDYIIEEVSKSYYEGLTILGGDPMEPENQEGIISLIRRMKKECSDKTIWLYTGYTYDTDLVSGGCRHTEYTDEILRSLETLVDGRFVLDKKNISLKFRGSENQRLIDMKASLKDGSVVLMNL